MSTFEVLVLPVDSVYDHPNADRLSIVKIRGYEAITAKAEDGSHRFDKGEPIVYVPEGAVIPLDVLRDRGYWNEEKNQGLLAGSQGNRVKAIKLRGVVSQGLVWKTESIDGRTQIRFLSGGDQVEPVDLHQDVAEFFNIQKYEEPIPASMSGQIFSLQEAKFDFDIENLKNYPTFLVDDDVEVTEKLHGTFTRIAWLGDIDSNERLVFLNSEENVAGNIYVRTLAENDFITRFAQYCQEHFGGARVHLLGETFGRGVQDLHYGSQSPTFRAFDVAITLNHETAFADSDTKAKIMADLGVERVPVIYRGKFDQELFDELRSGTTLVGGGNIREGIVITAVGDQMNRQADITHRFRPILKHISPEYLTRKGGTELQ